MLIIGNLGKDAEVRQHNGKDVINFTVAHSEKWIDNTGQQQERTTWVQCNWWKDQGQTRVADYLKAGQKVYVEGFPSVRPYTTKGGQQAASLELRVLSLELVGGNPDGKQDGNQGGTRKQGKPNPYEQAAAAPDVQVDDDLPF